MTDLLGRYRRGAQRFARVLARMRPSQLSAHTPCAEWDVRQLVNHMARGNLNYALLASGGSSSEFLALRDQDALGGEPLTAYGHQDRLVRSFGRTPAGVLPWEGDRHGVLR